MFMKQFLSVPQIAKLEKVDHTTALRWVHKGAFPNARRVGSVFRVPLEDYHRWREKTKVEPEAQRPEGRAPGRTDAPHNKP